MSKRVARRKLQSEKITITDEDKTMILEAAKRGYTNDQLGELMGCSAEALMKILARLGIRRNELAVARGRAGLFVTGKLFKEIERGNFAAIKFYCQTRLGMRTTDRVEITGANGTPIHTKSESIDPTREDILKEVAALRSRLEETYD